MSRVGGYGTELSWLRAYVSWEDLKFTMDVGSHQQQSNPVGSHHSPTVKRSSIKHTVATTAVPAAKVENAKGPQSLETTIAAMKSNRDEKRRLMATIDALDSQYTALAASLHGQDSS